MGIRGEIFSTKVSLQNRTYFFNVKENRMGDLYLNIVESKNRESGGFDRQSVILFAEDLSEFLSGFDESLKVLEKAVREQRKGDKPKSFQRSSAEGRDRPPRDRQPKDRPPGDRAPRDRQSGSRPPRNRTPRDRQPSSRPQGDKPPRDRTPRDRQPSGDRPPRDRQQARPRKRVVRKRD